MFFTTLVLLFIFKLRFPKGTPLTTILFRRYGRSTLNVFRRKERILRKLEHNKCDLEFLLKCKSYNVLPKFLYFKLYRKNLYNSKLYKSWQFKLLNLEIKSKNHNIRKFSNSLSVASDELKNSLSYLDNISVNVFLENSISKFTSKLKSTHKNKLESLGIHSHHSPLDPNKVVFNLSDRVISARERSLLTFGLNFGLPIFKLNFYSFFNSFEKLYRTLKKEPEFKPDTHPSLKSVLHNLSFRLFYNFKPYKIFSPLFSKNEINILRNLSKDKSIIICRPDKGRGVVILNRSDYINKMNHILSDTTKFKLINCNDRVLHTLHQEDKVNRVLNKLKKDGVLSESQYSDLSISGSSPGIMYGLPKIHKENSPLRPILSANNTTTYRIAKFLVPLLQPFTTNSYTIKNSFEFSKIITSFSNSNSYTMCSYDITSLFTQIPLQETINIILDKAFPTMNSTFHGFNRKQFKSVLELAVCNSFFIFNDNLYQQTDGVAMGSPLGPTLANIFLCHYETTWLNSCPTNIKPKLYTRYVDDTFVLFDNATKSQEFLTYLNRKHSNIKFTIEQEANNSLPFLDINVQKINNSFQTSIYRKSTFTGQGTNFHSFTPFIYKLNSIKTLIYRSYHLSSTYLNFHNDIEFLKNFFLANGFPLKLFQSCVKGFLSSIYSSKTKPCIVPKHKLYFSMPYMGYISDKLKNELQNIISKRFPHLDLVLVFKNNFTIHSFFKHKEKLSIPLCSSVVYLYKCGECNSSYIGSTKRQFRCRIAEHLGLSVRTGKPLQTPNNSAIMDHHYRTNHNISTNNFEILSKCANNIYDLRTIESLYISKFKPNLNSGTPVELDIFSFNH